MKGGERPDLEHLLGLGIKMHDRVPGHTEQNLDHLVLLGDLFLDKEEGHTIGLEGAAELDVAELGVELGHALELVVLLEDPLINLLDLNVLGREEVGKAGGKKKRSRKRKRKKKEKKKRRKKKRKKKERKGKRKRKST